MFSPLPSPVRPSVPGLTHRVQASVPAPQPTRAPQAIRARRDGLSPAGLRSVVLGTLALHGVAIWALMQVDSVREVVIESAPIFVSLFDVPARPVRASAAPTPPSLPAPPPPPRPPLPALAPPTPVTPPPIDSSPPLVAAAPSPAPSAREVALPSPAAPGPAPAAPAQPPLAAAGVAGPSVPASTVPLAAPAVAAAAPRQIPASAVRYLEAPAPVYPRQSIRMNESGTVSLRVFIDEAGLPRTVQVVRSSGAPRLDEAALAAVQKARFHPPTENGQPISGWARIDIPFELEK